MKERLLPVTGETRKFCCHQTQHCNIPSFFQRKQHLGFICSIVIAFASNNLHTIESCAILKPHYCLPINVLLSFSLTRILVLTPIHKKNLSNRKILINNAIMEMKSFKSKPPIVTLAAVFSK